MALGPGHCVWHTEPFLTYEGSVSTHTQAANRAIGSPEPAPLPRSELLAQPFPSCSVVRVSTPWVFAEERRCNIGRTRARWRPNRRNRSVASDVVGVAVRSRG